MPDNAQTAQPSLAPPRRWRRRLRRLGAIAASGGAIAYIGACGALYAFQTRIIFNASTVVAKTPRDYQLTYEDVWIPTPTANHPQGQLHGWWIPAEGKSRGVLLYLHGKGHAIDANIVQARRFQRLGWSVLLFDYRGFGHSQGPYPTEQSVYADAEAAWNYLRQQRQIAPQQIVIFGHSLGGAVAIDLAARHPEAAGLIAQSTFTSMRAMVDATKQYQLFPIDWLLTQRFDSLEKVKTLKIPVLYIHGTEDEVIPATMTPQLFAATPEPKQLRLYPGAQHNTVAQVGGQNYLQLLDQFLAQCLKSGRSPAH